MLRVGHQTHTEEKGKTHIVMVEEPKKSACKI